MRVLKNRTFRMPSAYTILFGIILVMMMLTWVVPAGQYEYIQNGDVSQPIAGTYHRVEANQQSIFDVILASFHGFYEAVEISLFILMVGGFLGVVMETGAINAGIARVIQLLRGREKYMIPILMILFGLGGTSFGMWEETMAFYPLLLPVFIAAGYDSITAVSVIMLGAGVGTLSSTVNPFATGIASGFAGISLGDGLLLRLLMLLVLEMVAITFVMRYAAKIYINPKASIVADQFEENKKRFAINFDDTESMTLTGKRKTALTIFAGTFLLMIYSVIPFNDLGITFLPTLGWYFTELSGLFLVAGIITGVATGMREQELIEGFVRGASDLLGVAFIIAISRGITVIMNSGFITDTILNWGEMALSGANSILFILLTYLLYLPLSFLIPSSSGLATLSIPIMVPLGEFTNISSALIITAFQSASGLVNLVTPTSAVVMGGLAVAHIPYDRWLKYIVKLVAIILVLTMVFLAAGALL